MEVGAVKQAFNNEVILLKKNLNQAKIQIIHKLTRKAKQLVGKKAPDPLKEKLKRKAQAAVNEVLLIKKVKPKDIAKFIVTHKGELKDILNKPTVDNDKVCARLLLHKALQEKYKFIRDRFTNVPIKDLFMSRLERRKMKKEAKENKEKKKKGKNSNIVNSEGDWDVEDVGKTNLSERTNDDNKLSEEDDDDHELKGEDSDDCMDSDGENEKSNGKDAESKDLPSDEEENNSEEDAEQLSSGDVENKDEESDATKSEDENSQAVEEVSNQTKIKPESEKSLENIEIQKMITEQTSNIKPKKTIKKTQERKQKDIDKHKHFNEKIQQKKLNKDAAPVVANKIVDPFFVTATGENYMSVVEPRDPDEVKEEHQQGNRKLRRAAMFGHVPNTRPRKNNSSYRDDSRFGKNSNKNGNKFNNWRGDNNNKPFNNNFNDRKRVDDKFNNRRQDNNKLPFNNNFNDRKRFDDFNTRREANNVNTFNDRKNVYDKFSDKKEEKLHPSWEAKKKKSGILPFEGKKIVFDDES
ncbi:unnamed protein product [Arctia plantaginis]|uniref:Serum response factor-binding protein 1 n=1 Tax=Arctia plantaginis TaxID=874455 RepID=A0A8S1ACC3_ARCPL|nr:unnamed protein product [Arctia plantaginis]CAB3253851.1 unnamed protein product [Arctia plantaginis]